MNIVVHDDNFEFLSFMRDSLDKLNSKNDGAFGKPIYISDPKDVLSYANDSETATVFILDIMTGSEQTGFELAKLIKKINPDNLVFYATDYSEKVLLSKMEEQMLSLGFIYKGSERFLLDLEEGLNTAHDLLSGMFFIAETHKNIYKRRFDEIYYFQKLKNSSVVAVRHKYGIDTYRDNLVNIKKKLCSHFCYATKEYIVNTKAVTHVDKDSKMLYFGEEDKCPFSRTRKKELLKWISG